MGKPGMKPILTTNTAMNIYLYILSGWLLFVVMVYSYAYYDTNAEHIKIRERWKRLVDAFTEEE